MDLVEFLRARLTDDERLARLSIDEQESRLVKDRPDQMAATEDGLLISHSRVLAEVEAKRRIIDKFEHFNDRDDMPQAILTLDWTLRVLALPYAGHPDFNPAWAVAQRTDVDLS